MIEENPDAAIELLRWDSAHFGFPVARVPDPLGAVQMQSAVDLADRDGVRCLTALVKADQIEAVIAAEELGFRCYDVRTALERRIDGKRRTLADLDLRLVEEADLSQLEPIAEKRFSATRFAADPHFPDDLVASLYVAWLRRGHRDEDRRVIATEGLDGFVVCRVDEADSVGVIELIAVAPSSERRGLGSRLLRGSEALFASEGLTRAHVVTQGRNVPAQRLYQAQGYRTTDMSLWFHRWMPSR